MRKRVLAALAALTVGMAGAAVPGPEEVSHRIIRQFLSTRPDAYEPVGMKGHTYVYGGGKHIFYATASLWVNAMECALLTGQKNLRKALLEAYEPYENERAYVFHRIKHVDWEITGAVPLEVAIQNGRSKIGRRGLWYADRQWEKPRPDDETKGQPASFEERMKWWEQGYSPETRLWIDDMYMISLLQIQAYRYTGKTIYLDRAAKEMALYLERLPQRDGLFCHAVGCPFIWGRGDGWMAAAMAMLLKELPSSHPNYYGIMKRYRQMMEALLRHQRKNGLWGQLVDDPESWDETSGSAMFAYAFAEGVHNGWLGAEYAAARDRAYEALVGRLDEHGNLADVCIGTGARNDRDWYMNRNRVNGDPHGQAPMLWLCRAMLQNRLDSQRYRTIAPVNAGELRVRPTFCSVGVCYGSEAEIPGLRLEIREEGGEWREARTPPHFAETGDYRGSIMDLKEDTAYEVRIDGKTAAFRTWRSDVPVAKTVVVDPAQAKFPIVIDAKGSEDGWIRYTLAKGTKLANPTTESMFCVTGAQYVLLDDMTLEGGPARRVIEVVDSSFVRIRNCDISKWGRVGRHNFDSKGQYCEVRPDGRFGQSINYDPAIAICRGTTGAVVERCYVHDPNGHSVSWYYCHPAGPEAVMLYRPDHSTVIRDNDFVGSDVHRWNDAVESSGNFLDDGGFNRDADVYGNFMFCANDDCIELDGGQQNVRSFRNRYECALCGVSLQGCMVSPVYVKDDLFVNIVDENNTHGQTIKMSSFDRFSRGPWAFLSGLLGKGHGRGPRTTSLRYPERFIQEECAFDEPMANRERYDRPVRALSFDLDTGRIGGISVRGGKVSEETVEVTAIHDGKGAAVPFTVRVNDATDWFSVSPREGVIEPGGKAVLTVRFDASKMNDRRHYRGAFLVRAPNGLSRVCSIDAETDFLMPDRPDPAAEYFPLGKVSLRRGQSQEFEFEVREEGRYMIAIQGRSTDPQVRWPKLTGAVDGDRPEPYDQYFYKYPAWALVVPGRGQDNRTRYYKLAPGRHKVRLEVKSGGMTVTQLAITCAPELFKPR